MLKITLLAVGNRMPAWVQQGFAEYQKRIGGRFRLDLVEIPALRRGKNADIPRIRQQEEARVLESVPSPGYLIALDRNGAAWSTRCLAQNMGRWLDQGEPVALAVGGPEGFSDQFLGVCRETWSLSALTFAHPLVRVILAEQLYRGFSIVEGLPYHR